MGLIYSLILGGVAGWLASILMKNDSNQGLLLDIIFGIIGGLIGGWVMNFFGQSGVTGFNLYSLIVSVIGASILIAIGRALKL